jgi:hypothetical protein
MAADSPTVQDGDIGFVGYASRLNPVSLPAGMLQLSENMRLDRGTAVTRKGAKRLADDISPADTPLTIPFILSDPPPIIRSVYTGGVFASAVMRSPDDVNSMEVVVLAGSDRAYTYVSDGSLLFSAAWADGVLAVDGNENLVTSAGADAEEIIVSKIPTELTYPTGPDETIEPTDNVYMVQAFDRLYLLREADTSIEGWETKYTAGSGSSGISVLGAVATVNVASHGYLQGATVRIENSTSPAFDGHEYRVRASNLLTHSFEIDVPSGTPADSSPNIKVRKVKPPLYWSGDPTTDFVRTDAGIPDVGISYRRMRSAPWAAYINNRLIVPDGRSNIMLSDIYDPDTFDPFWQSFRVNVGGNDKVVAVHPWVDGTFLVFCRKSIWIATVNQTASTDGSASSITTPLSNLELLTDEIGCAARRTIVTAGQFIYFLSDAGVYRLDSRLDLKLRGQTLPLSDPIANQLQGLDASRVEDSVGLYFDNRYYLAVPLNNPANAGTNNGVFIYNQLNEAWETRDIYGFGVDNFLVADRNNERRIYISNQAGKLMLLNEVEAGDESPSSEVNVTTAITGRIVTRRYGFNSMHSKRFLRAMADVVLPDTAAVTIKALTINPDRQITLIPSQTNASGTGEDYTLKNSIRQRAHYCDLEFTTTVNRPEIRNVSIEGAMSNMPQTETRHAS